MSEGVQMKEYRGKSVFGGIAIGKICVYRKGEQQVKRVKTEDTDDEMQRYTRAKGGGSQSAERPV